MKPRNMLRAVNRNRGVVVLVLTLALVIGIVPFAGARAYTDGGGTGARYAAYTVTERAYAPYTAGPVVAEVALGYYAPYTAGPVVAETPMAAYTPAKEKPYAPYTAGPVVPETPRTTGGKIGNFPVE